ISGTITRVALTGSPYSVSLVTDDGNGGTASQTLTWNVSAGNFTVQAMPVTATEGASLNGITVATIADSDPQISNGNFTATINWGDGSTGSASIDPNGVLYTVTSSHL